MTSKRALPVSRRTYDLRAGPPDGKPCIHGTGPGLSQRVLDARQAFIVDAVELVEPFMQMRPHTNAVLHVSHGDVADASLQQLRNSRKRVLGVVGESGREEQVVHESAGAVRAYGGHAWSRFQPHNKRRQPSGMQDAAGCSAEQNIPGKRRPMRIDHDQITAVFEGGVIDG